MIEKPYEIAVIPLETLADLILMAESSAVYRQGLAWPADALGEARRVFLNTHDRLAVSAED